MLLKTIAIVGPGGSVGTAIISALLNDSQFQITALVRPTSNFSPPASDRIRTIATDFEDRTSLIHALRNQDAVVCCVPGGATRFGPQKLLIDAAIEAGVKLFFASEFVSNILSPNYQLFPTEFVGDKVRVREYLAEKAAAGQIAYTALNGGPFFDMWLSKGVAGFDIPARKATIYGSGNNLSCWTPLPTIASAAVKMLQNPNTILNRAIFISGVRGLTQKAILAALEAETGQKFSVEHVDVRKIREEALVALREGDVRKATRGLTINSQFNEDDSVANFWDRVENEVVGVRAVDVREAVGDFLRTR
ncbi:hypothetical protein MMC28_005741 [Mycoblastus sanguinarius]|nr:hypothetical protein [Mycoblastus sanguinarius]